MVQRLTQRSRVQRLRPTNFLFPVWMVTQEYILDFGVHIIDLELTSHYEARNKSSKLTENKNDFYKLIVA